MPASRDYSPVHVTVDERTPVHVHIQKPRKPSAQAVTERLARPRHRTASGKKPAGSSGGRASKSPPKSPGPWIPPPARSSKGVKTDEPERDTDDVGDYEERVETLMNEVGKLKSEAELSRAQKQLAGSQERLAAAAAENSSLRKSVEFLDDNRNNEEEEERYSGAASPAKDGDDSSSGEDFARRIGSTELELQSLNRHLLAFGDILGSLRPPLRQSERDAVQNMQQDLSERVGQLSESLYRLRSQLTSRGDAEREALGLSRERGDLLRRLAQSEESRRCLAEELGAIKQQLADQRQQELATSGLQSALESAKGHLQFQLRQREADCNRLAVQLRSVEGELAQARIDRDHLAELLRRERDSEDNGRDELKRAARALKQRSVKAESEVERLKEELAAANAQKQQLQAESEQLRGAAASVVRSGGDDRERLAESVRNLERQLEQQRSEMEGLRNTLRHYEGLIEDYKQQNEQQSGKSASTLERAEVAQQETRVLRERCEDLERRLRSAEEERREAQQALARREEAGSSVHSQLEAKQRECSALMQQLEQALTDSRRAGDRDGAAAREKKLQSRLMELETQMASNRADAARAMREKEEELRRSQQRMEDQKERMEQMQSANRSLHNYVNFLKTSYANVFSGAGTVPPMQ